MIEIKGKNGISAKIVADSVSKTGVRMVTMELEYPRFILSEMNTHRMLSKNSASSRAIPVNRMIELINENPAIPVHWGKNQSGMVAQESLPEFTQRAVQAAWLAAKDYALSVVRVLSDSGLHKQVANRVSEPWQRMKTVISGTEWANLLWLRDHADAQPEFAELASCIRQVMESSNPVLLHPHEWHLPYIATSRLDTGEVVYLDTNGERLSLSDAVKISTSCCAQVSYRRLDDSKAKALDIYEKLIGADRKHFSPFEHQATPMFSSINARNFINQPTVGVTHADKWGNVWSGNFRGWIQHRKILEENFEI